MDLLLACADDAASEWEAAFRAALPEATVHRWPHAPAVVDYAAVWKPPAEVFARVRVRRAIANLGAGVDALLAVPTLPVDVPVLRLTDAGMAEQMAEYVTLAVLSAYREQQPYAQQQRQRRWVQRARIDKASFGVGILGLGVLGEAVMRALAPFGFPLFGWRRAPHEHDDIETFAGSDGLHAMLTRSRVLVCMLPLTGETRGLLDRGRLALLPRGAHLVNVSRGALVVDDDLLALLDVGHLASATLDVFAAEPLPASHRFWHHPAVTLTPHVSAATLIDVSVAQFAARLRALERGEAVDGWVDRRRGY